MPAKIDLLATKGILRCALGEILADRDLFPRTSSRAIVSCMLLLLLAAPWAVYHKVGEFDFVTFDDGIHVYANPKINPPTKKSLGELWKAPYQGLYVPLTYTAWAIQAKLSGAPRTGNSAALNPRLFHLVNVGFHSLNTALVFLLLLALSVKLAPAFLGALLFAWHPLQVEPVTWISSLKDLLSGFFVLLGLLQYVRFAKGGENAKRAYVFSIGAFLLGLLAKPAALVFPLLAGIIDIGILRRSWRQSVPAWAPWLILAVPVAWVTKTQQPDRVIDFITPWLYRPVVAADALVFYLSKLVFPLFLTLNYGHTAKSVVENPAAPWTIVGLVVILGLLWRRQERRVWLSCSALFVAYLLPVLGFLPFYFQKFSTVADRFAYLALLGPCLAVGWWLGKGGVLRYAPVLIFLTFFGLKSYRQTDVWRDNQSFIRQVSQMNPRDADIQYGMAIVLSEESQPPGGGSFYSHMLRLKPGERNEAVRQQKQLQAIHHFKEAIRLDPKHAFAHNNLALVYHRMGDLGAAIEHFRAAIAIEPEMGQAHNNLGSLLAQTGRLDEAVTSFEEAVKLAPTEARPRVNLAFAYDRLGKTELAKKSFSRALELDGADALARRRLAELGHISKLAPEGVSRRFGGGEDAGPKRPEAAP